MTTQTQVEKKAKRKKPTDHSLPRTLSNGTHTLNGSINGSHDSHDSNGYYEIQVPLPLTPSMQFPSTPLPIIFEERQSLHGLRVSEEDYWAHYYDLSDVSYEWNNGILEEKPMPDLIRITMYGWLHRLLQSYLEVHPIAKILFLEMGFRLALEEKITARKPDLFIVRNDNPVPLLDTDRSYHGTCDLSVESVSDSTQEDVERDTVVKKDEYERLGIKEYYVLDPGDEMAFYRLDATGHYQKIQPDTEGVIHSEVLPGFRFRVADLHSTPTFDQLADDPLYQSFVMLKYQAEKLRAEKAEEQIRIEKERAKIAEEQARLEKERAQIAEKQARTEKERADRYAALFRQMGMEPPP